MCVFLQIDYPAFSKDFYVEHPEISGLSQPEVKDTRKKLGVRVSFSFDLYHMTIT